VQADDVALGQENLQALDGLGIAVAKSVGVVEENDLHAHRFRKHRKLRSDIAVADNSECTTSHLVAVGRGFVPSSLVGCGRAWKDAPKQHHNLADHQFRHATGVRERSVKNRNAALAGSIQIDLVRTDAETSHRDQSVGIRKNIAGQPGSRTNAQQVDSLDGLTQRVCLEGFWQAFDAQIFRIQE
jgi:hypothetical protein